HRVACKINQNWQTEVQQGSVLNEVEHYVTATGEENKAIEHYLKGAVSGASLSTDDELKQIQDGWQ
ncbi:MAG: hypothetical protein MJK04_14140, partial [Psychrosphaera sp.]|nr:hypothetical protein [Psychrosphaera sp.]